MPPVCHSPGHASRFIGLPPELRNEIYRLVMPETVDIATIRKLYIPLLHVCRQIHREGSAMLYRNSAFSIDLTVSCNYTKLLDWIYGLDRVEVASIRHLKLISTLKLECPSGHL